MRDAKTIEDVRDLLGDYEARLELVEGGLIYVQFPQAFSDMLSRFNPVARQTPEIPNDPFHLNFSRRCRNVLLDLLSSSRFWRVTTVADQLGSFVRFYDGKKYGAVKCTKKGGQPFTIHFQTPKDAENFFHLLQEIDKTVA